jgi:hypothetical protein
MRPANTDGAVGLAQALRSADWLDRQRVFAYAAILGAFEVALALFWIFGARHNVDLTGKPLGTDFISFWSASRLALDGTPALAYRPEIHAAVEASQVGGAAIGYFSFFYPPAFLLACLPLALLPYGASLACWLLATAALFVLVMRAWLPRLTRGGLAACLTFPAILINAGHGQNGFLIAALFGSGFLLLDKRPWLAGALLGALVLKPQLAILVPFALAFSGRWQAFGAAAASALLLAGISWAVLGGEAWTGFFSALFLAQQTLSQGIVSPAKMVSLFAAARLWQAPPLLALALQLAAALAMLVLFARHAASTSGPALGALTATATLLATPFALDYDLTLLALPMAFLLRAGRETGFLPYEKLVLLCSFALPLAVRPLAMGLAIPVAPVVIAGLLGLLVIRMRRTGSFRTATPFPGRPAPAP